MLSPDQAFTRVLYQFPEAQATVAMRRRQIVQTLTECLFINRYIIPPQIDYSELNPNLQPVIAFNQNGEGINPSGNSFAPSEDVVKIRRAKYTGRHVATSCKVSNVFTVNQRKFWETLGWSTLGVSSTLVGEIPKDWRILSSILALGLLLKEYRGLQTHEFDEYEAQILYTLYDLNNLTNKIHFSQLQINTHYFKLFGQRLEKDLLEKILAELTKIYTLAQQGGWYFLNETIRFEY